MPPNRVADRPRRHSRRYGRADVIHDATTLLMEQFDLDAGQAVALLVKVAKQQTDSIEAVARRCIAASLDGERYVGAPEPVRDEPHHRGMRAEWIRHRVGPAVA